MNGEKHFQSVKDNLEKLALEVPKSGLLVEHIELLQAIFRKLEQIL